MSARTSLENYLLNALRNQDSAQNRYNIENVEAAAQYKNDLEIGVTNDNTFARYVENGNCPGFVASKTQLANSDTTISQTQRRISAPMGRQIMDDRVKVAKGQDMSRDFPPYVTSLG